MFILYAIPLGILAGFALGGRLQGLATIHFKWAWVFLIGLAIQLVLFSDFVTGWIGEAGMPIYVGSTLAVAAVVAANFRIRGMPIVLAGAASNLTAIIANGGYMPASAGALESLGFVDEGVYSNSSYVENPALPWLTDIFAMPAWMPSANVFSVGDILIGVGVVVVIASAMRTRLDPVNPPDRTRPDPTRPESAPA